MRMLKIGVTLVLLLVIGSYACSDSVGPEPGTIGPAGGTLELFDGAVRLVIPAGALPTATSITVERQSDPTDVVGVVPGTAYRFLPAGLTFATPVTLVLRYDPADLPPAADTARLALHKRFSTGWEPIGQTTVDVAGNRISTAIGGFSEFAAVAGSTLLWATTRTTGEDLDPDGYVINVFIETFGTAAEVEGWRVGINESILLSLHASFVGYLGLDDIAPNCSGPELFELLLTPGDAIREVVFDVECSAIVHDVTVTMTGDGPALITSSPAGIDCENTGDGAVCVGTFAHGTALTLAGTGGLGTQEKEWEGCPTAIEWDCELIVTQPYYLTFNTTFREWNMEVTRSGDGSGTVIGYHSGTSDDYPVLTCGSECVQTLPAGIMTLKAVADDGSEFVGYSGDCGGTEESVSIVLDTHRTCDARFDRLPVIEDVTLMLTGVGHATATLEPGGHVLEKTGEADVSATYGVEHGQEVEVTVETPEGEGVGFDGCESVIEDVCRATVTGTRTITVTLPGPVGPTGVDVTIIGEGSVTLRETGEVCSSGTCPMDADAGVDVHLDPRPAAGHRFVKWLSPEECRRIHGPCPVTVPDAGAPRLVAQAEFEEIVSGDFAPFFAGLIDGIEAIYGVHRRVPVAVEDPVVSADAGGAVDPVSPDCPVLMAAGAGGAVAFEACTGSPLAEFPAPGFTAYDAIPLPRPDGETGSHGLLFSGAGFRLCPVNDQGELDGFCHISFGTNDYPDAVVMGLDPANGAILVNRTWRRLDRARYVSGSGFIVEHDWVPSDLLPAGVQTAVSNPAGDKLLVLSSGSFIDYMHWVDLSVEPARYSATQDAGSARRIRCDFETQLCAISRYGGSSSTRRLSFFRWDGESEPRITEDQKWNTVTIASHGLAHGPVGIDVMGNRIVTAGYVDNQYSIITVDFNDPDWAFTVVTAPAPAGCTNPGHAMFMRDAANSIVLSCHGSGGVAVVPNAFP